MLMTIVAMGCPLLAVACVLVPPLRQDFVQFMSGQLELQAIALICMGLVMIVLGGTQLFRLDNDAIGAQYYRGLNAGLNAWGRQNRFGRSVGLMGKWSNWLSTPGGTSTSRWSAVCRWRVGMPNGWTSWLLGVVVVVAVEFAAWAWAVAGGSWSRQCSSGCS